jgi:2-polyprenyl-6-hydroxyphenyl methylase/3-demethylubiquinone-9 3-methyltransferase
MNQPVPEYGYQSAEASCAHGYLVPTVLNALMKWQPRPPCRVLDAGCGNGYTAGVLLRKGFEVVGVDASEAGIALARAAHPEGRFECLSLYEDVRDRLGSFDAIVSTEVIEHLYDPRRFVARMKEALYPGGLVIVSTPYHGYLKNLVMAIVGKWDRHLTAMWDGGHIKFWSRSTLCALLEENGFEILDFLGSGRLAWLWKSMIVVARKPLAGHGS